MKHVSKGTALEMFIAWQATVSADWTPTYDSLQNPEKQTLHVSLLAEQGWVCCYCGRVISQVDSHIEHFRPQKLYADLALQYENLMVSCIREMNPGTPFHCGHAKGSKFDEDLQISPFESDCEARFNYALDGQIMTSAVSDDRATYMINLLKLDITFLRNRREEVVARVFDPSFLGTVTKDELQVLCDYYRQTDEQGRAPSFGHVLARYAEQRLADSAL